MASRSSGLGRGVSWEDSFCACPIDTAFSVMGRKWAVLLIRNMLRGDRHFNEFLSHIEGINPKALSTRLKELEQEKLIVKKVTRSTPVRIEYELTKKGYAVVPILHQMARWSIRWAPDKLFEGGKPPKTLEKCWEEWVETLNAPNVHVSWTASARGLAVPNGRGRKRPAAREASSTG